MNIRIVKKTDLSTLKNIIDSTGLFPSEYLDDMINPYFQTPEQEQTEFWIVCENENNHPIGLAYYAPERMTQGTYNLYLIAIHKIFQGKNMGTTLLKYIENHLKKSGQRILLVETSGLPNFQETRNFYLKNNYGKEAIVREFYAEGEDKVIFWKKL